MRETNGKNTLNNCMTIIKNPKHTVDKRIRGLEELKQVSFVSL